MFRLICWLLLVVILFTFGHYYVFYGAAGDSARYFQYQPVSARVAYVVTPLTTETALTEQMISSSVADLASAIRYTAESTLISQSRISEALGDAVQGSGSSVLLQLFEGWLPSFSQDLGGISGVLTPLAIVAQIGSASNVETSCFAICSLRVNTVGIVACSRICDAAGVRTTTSFSPLVNLSAVGNSSEYATRIETSAPVTTASSVSAASAVLNSLGWSSSDSGTDAHWLAPGNLTTSVPAEWISVGLETGIWGSTDAAVLHTLPVMTASTFITSSVAGSSVSVGLRVRVVFDATDLLREVHRRSRLFDAAALHTPQTSPWIPACSAFQLPVANNSIQKWRICEPSSIGSLQVTLLAADDATTSGGGWVAASDYAVLCALLPTVAAMRPKWTIGDACSDHGRLLTGCALFGASVGVMGLSLCITLAVLWSLQRWMMSVADACSAILRPVDNEFDASLTGAASPFAFPTPAMLPIDPPQESTPDPRKQRDVVAAPSSIENSFTITNTTSAPTVEAAVKMSRPSPTPLRSPSDGMGLPAPVRLGEPRATVANPFAPSSTAPATQNPTKPAHQQPLTMWATVPHQQQAGTSSSSEGCATAMLRRMGLGNWIDSLNVIPEEITHLKHCVASARSLARQLLPFAPNNVLAGSTPSPPGTRTKAGQTQVPTLVVGALEGARATNVNPPSPNPLFMAAAISGSSTLIAIADVTGGRQATDASSLSSISYANSEDIPVERQAQNVSRMMSSRRHSGSIRKRLSTVRAGADCRLVEKKHVAVVIFNARSFHTLAFASQAIHQLLNSPFGDRIPSAGHMGGGKQSSSALPASAGVGPIDNEIIRAVALMSSSSARGDDPALGSPVTSFATTTVTANGAGPLVSGPTSSMKQFAQVFADFCDKLTAITKLHRGSLDYINGDHVVVSFNATLDCSLPAKAALMWISHVKDAFRDDGLMGKVECGAAIGSCHTGLVGTEGHRRAAVMGPLVTHAAELLRLVRRCPPAVGVSNLVSSRIARELQHEFHFALMGSVALPDSCSLSNVAGPAAGGVMMPTTAQGSTIELGTTQSPEAILALQVQETLVYAFLPSTGNAAKIASDRSNSKLAASLQRTSVAAGQGEEWLYQVGKNETRNPFTKANATMQQVSCGNLLAAEALIAEHNAEVDLQSRNGPPTRLAKVDGDRDLKPAGVHNSLRAMSSVGHDDVPSPQRSVAGPQAAADALWVAIEDAVRRRAHSIFT